MAQRDITDSPAYLIKDMIDNTELDNILESQCSSITDNGFIDYMWNNFSYTGDNQLASSWCLQKILGNISLNNIKYGPKENNTKYEFSINNESNVWTKNISN